MTSFSNDLVIDGVARNLEIIGEAARQIPEDFRSVHTQIPWTQMAGLRNRIVHDYFGLDLEIIWEISSTIFLSSSNKSALFEAEPLSLFRPNFLTDAGIPSIIHA